MPCQMLLAINHWCCKTSKIILFINLDRKIQNTNTQVIDKRITRYFGENVKQCKTIRWKFCNIISSIQGYTAHYYGEYRSCDNSEIIGGEAIEPYEETCKRKCDETINCNVFYYMPSKGYCGLYSKCDRFRRGRGKSNIFRSNDGGDMNDTLSLSAFPWYNRNFNDTKIRFHINSI